MTRATLIVIDDKKYYNSCEFNGDGYPEGHGLLYMKIVEKITSVEEFKKIVEFFTKKLWFSGEYAHRGGEDMTTVYEGKKNKIFNTRSVNAKYVDFTKDYFDLFFSDWVFIKNLSKDTIAFLCKRNFASKTEEAELVLLKPNEQIAFNFGYSKGMFQSVKEGIKVHKIEEYENEYQTKMLEFIENEVKGEKKELA
jgi:hypothetical protein